MLLLFWRKHFRGEMGCLPERCRAPQNGDTPLCVWVKKGGDAVVVAKLLAAGADKEAKNGVRRGGGKGEEEEGGGLRLERSLGAEFRGTLVVFGVGISLKLWGLFF